jgi:hypothetical protein
MRQLRLSEIVLTVSFGIALALGPHPLGAPVGAVEKTSNSMEAPATFDAFREDLIDGITDPERTSRLSAIRVTPRPSGMDVAYVAAGVGPVHMRLDSTAGGFVVSYEAFGRQVLLFEMDQFGHVITAGVAVPELPVADLAALAVAVAAIWDVDLVISTFPLLRAAPSLGCQICRAGCGVYAAIVGATASFAATSTCLVAGAATAGVAPGLGIACLGLARDVVDALVMSTFEACAARCNCPP